MTISDLLAFFLQNVKVGRIDDVEVVPHSTAIRVAKADYDIDDVLSEGRKVARRFSLNIEFTEQPLASIEETKVMEIACTCAEPCGWQHYVPTTVD